MKFLLALVALQGAPLEAEKERIRSKPPLTAEARKAYSFPAVKVPEGRVTYRLAVVPLSFADRPSAAKDLDRLFFNEVAKYFDGASGKRFDLQGKVYAPVALGVERSKFEEPELDRALQALVAREGDGLTAAFDAVAFVAAGGLGARGGPLWPHKGTFRRRDVKPEYVLVSESMDGREVGIVAHEMMHLLGFRDKYDDEKAAVGDACILGTGYASPKPAPPCAECREKLGWAAPAPVDPRRAASVVLEPDVRRPLKVPLNPDASEYLLLELRERMLVWHVGGGRRIELVGRFPSESSDRLTPLSDPPLRGRTAGAWPVWITDIRIEDGKAWFRVGPDAPLTPLEEQRKANVGKRLGD